MSEVLRFVSQDEEGFGYDRVVRIELSPETRFPYTCPVDRTSSVPVGEFVVVTESGQRYCFGMVKASESHE